MEAEEITTETIIGPIIEVDQEKTIDNMVEEITIDMMIGETVINRTIEGTITETIIEGTINKGIGIEVKDRENPRNYYRDNSRERFE